MTKAKDSNYIMCDVSRYVDEHMPGRMLQVVSENHWPRPDSQWTTAEVRTVWISDGPVDCRLHAIVNDSEQSWTISRKTWHDWQRVRADARLRILVRASGGTLRLAKVPSSELLGIHLTTDQKKQIEQDAGDCGLTMSEYCRHKLLDGVPPRQALSEKEREMLTQLSSIQRSMMYFYRVANELSKTMTNVEKMEWIVNGREWEPWRQQMFEVVRIINEFKKNIHNRL